MEDKPVENVSKTSDMRPVIRSQWGYQGTAYGCMNCGFGVIAPIYNYCPNCGAVMSDEVVGKTAPVNVIRCRDCKHRPTRKEGFVITFPDYRCPCQCEDAWYNWYPDDNWFCANGERGDADA